MCPAAGPAKKDCFAEFGGTAKHLNQPFFNPAKPTKLPKQLVCFDGDPGCDVDGLVDQKCTFNVDVCLYNDDPNLSECTPATVSEVSAKAKKGDASALEAALAGLTLPAAASTCTQGATVVVPLKVNKKGAQKKAKAKVSVKAKTGSGTDSDGLKLTCLPREWPVHGYDRANTRASLGESEISTGNVAQLEMKWEWLHDTAVTSTPTLGDKLVYVGDWKGVVHALSRKNGKEKWSFDTGAGPFGGIPGSVTVLADGRVLVGTAKAEVFALDGKKGTLLWKQSVGRRLRRPHLGRAGAGERQDLRRHRVPQRQPLHPGPPRRPRRHAGHLPLGAQDPSREHLRQRHHPRCAPTTSDCGGGSCVAAVGGGVTTTSALSATGDTVYTASVGCFTAPSVGNSDSIFSIDAATGDANWIHRTQSIEPFGNGPLPRLRLLERPAARGRRQPDRRDRRRQGWRPLRSRHDQRRARCGRTTCVDVMGGLRGLWCLQRSGRRTRMACCSPPSTATRPAGRPDPQAAPGLRRRERWRESVGVRPEHAHLRRRRRGERSGLPGHRWPVGLLRHPRLP